jgi:hypothetical protein
MPISFVWVRTERLTGAVRRAELPVTLGTDLELDLGGGIELIASGSSIPGSKGESE